MSVTTGEGQTVQVWIDQDLCTGDGLCEQICPDVFKLESDGMSYVFDSTGIRQGGPNEAGRFVTVPAGFVADVLDAAAECPGECIFIEGEATAAA